MHTCYDLNWITAMNKFKTCIKNSNELKIASHHLVFFGKRKICLSASFLLGTRGCKNNNVYHDHQRGSTPLHIPFRSTQTCKITIKLFNLCVLLS